MMTWSYLDLFYSKVKFGNLGFSMGKSETVDFSETIAANDLKVGRCRHLITISGERLQDHWSSGLKLAYTVFADIHHFSRFNWFWPLEQFKCI